MLLGSSSVVEMILTIIRTKILAMILGPAGIGLAGILNHIMATVSIFFEMGTGTSATRSVAATLPAQRRRIGRLLTVIILLGIVLGAVGAVSVFFAATPIAVVMFSDAGQAWLIQLLAVGVLFTVAGGIQRAFINGLRRYQDLARITIFSSLIGTVASIAIAWYYQFEGIIVYVIAVPLINSVITFYYVMKTRYLPAAVCYTTIKKETSAMLKLGLPVMLSVLIDSAVILYVRGQVMNTLGLEAVGLFQVAWAITGIYVGFILTAMMKEYYPRLTALVRSNTLTNTAVNQQMVIAIWLTTPLLLGVAALAPLMVTVLYSDEFLPIVDTLRWMALGTVLKVMAWSMGFVWVARGKGRYVIADSVLWSIVFVAGVALVIDYVGMTGIGWVYTASFVFAVFYTYVFVRDISGFRLERKAILESSILVIGCIFCIIANRWLSLNTAFLFSGIVYCLMSVRALFSLYKIYKNH